MYNCNYFTMTTEFFELCEGDIKMESKPEDDVLVSNDRKRSEYFDLP